MLLPEQNLLLSAKNRWSRIHSGGFVKAAKAVAVAKRDMEIIALFNEDSALKNPEVCQRANSRLDAVIAENLAILEKTMVDLRQTEIFTRTFAPEISDCMEEDLEFRQALIADLQTQTSSEILHKLLILVYELEHWMQTSCLLSRFPCDHGHSKSSQVDCGFQPHTLPIDRHSCLLRR